MRAVRSVISNAIVGTADVVILGANNNRRSVVLANNSATAVYFTFGQVAVVGQGIRMNTGAPPVILCYEMFGTLLAQDIHSIALAASSPVTVIAAESCGMEV